MIKTKTQKRAELLRDIEELQRLTEWNDSEVAHHLGVSKSTVCKWKSHATRLPAEVYAVRVKGLLAMAQG